MTDPADTQTSHPTLNRARREFAEIAKFIAGAVVVFLLINTVVFRVFFIPSESMQPTLEVGDRVLVTTFSYGWSRHSLPFGLGRGLPQKNARMLTWLPGVKALPDRGDVVVFLRPPAGERDRGEHIIKRVVGLPGDRIQVTEGRLYVNGEVTDRQVVDNFDYRTHKERVVTNVTVYTETFPDQPDENPHRIFERGDNRGADNTREIIVAPGYIFVMGDNRDGSRDSRVSVLEGGWGQVPVEQLVGRAVTVLFTLERCRNEGGLRCPGGRVWRPL